MFFMEQNFKRHFRIYLKSGHPAYIVDEEGNKFLFHRVTKSPKSGHHTNWEINPNPDKTKKKPMYIVHNQEEDYKYLFTAELPYNIQLDFIKVKQKKK